MPLAPGRRWEGSDGRPVSQETSFPTISREPSRKGVAVKQICGFLTRAVAAGAVPVVACVALVGIQAEAPAAQARAVGHPTTSAVAQTRAGGHLATSRVRAHAAGAATVTVRVEGLDHTLLAATAVSLGSGSVTNFGAPAGSCPDASAQGALDAATNGRWYGTWNTEYSEYFVTRILGDLQSGASDYWALYVNNAFAAAGACQTQIKPGDAVMFAAVPSKGGTPEALGVSLPLAGHDGQKVRPRVVYYTPKGVAHPLAGASVSFNGQTLRTRANGRTAPITLRGHGKRILRVAKQGFIRDVATIMVRA